MGKLEDLEKLQKLKESGVLTEEEFNLEKARILNGTTNNINVNTDSNDEEILEIKGNFPSLESKIPIQLKDDEKIIKQSSILFIYNIRATLTLTNKRLIFSRNNGKTAALNMLAGGIVGAGLSSINGRNIVDFSIYFNNIKSIESTNNGGLKVLTKTLCGTEFNKKMKTGEGYVYEFFLPLDNANPFNKKSTIRDEYVKLIKTAIE